MVNSKNNITTIIDNVNKIVNIYYDKFKIGYADFKKQILKVETALTIEEWLFLFSLLDEIKKEVL